MYIYEETNKTIRTALEEIVKQFLSVQVNSYENEFYADVTFGYVDKSFPASDIITFVAVVRV